jgi:hypothetical protein
MVFDMNGKPLVGRIKTWALGDGPAFQGAIKLKPEVIMQTRGVVFLDQIAKGAPTLATDLPLGSWVSLKSRFAW